MADDIPAGETGKEPVPAPALTITLQRPVLLDGNQVNELSFREPTARDIEQYGMPVHLAFSEEGVVVHFNERKMASMLGGLAGVPPTSIRSMHPKDWSTAAWHIAHFFTPDLTT